MTIALRAEALSRRYVLDGENVDAVKKVSLVVSVGEFVALTGPSGSGKSTLLHLLGGLDLPTSGTIEIGGVALHGLDAAGLAKIRNRDIGFVFQGFNLMPGLTVAENVGLPAMIAGRRPWDVQRTTASLLSSVGLEAKSDRYPAQLSGGEQQRAAIARALINEPAIILADEPTGNLDSRGGDEILRLLAACNADGQTIVLVTHDLRLATRASRVVKMRDGRLTDDTQLGGRRPSIAEMVSLGDLPEEGT